MTDYLQSVSRAWRIFSIVGCSFTSIICLLLSFLLWTDMIQRHSFDYEGKPLWIGAVLVGVLGMAAAYVAWRLVCHHAAANGITVLPIWLIQLFGVLILIGQGFVAYQKGSVLLLAEGVSVCLAMIFVGRAIAKRQIQRHQQLVPVADVGVRPNHLPCPMTLQDFNNITLKVIREDGVADYLPTLAYPDTQTIRAIQGIPEKVDHREAIQHVIRRPGGEKREFFFGVRSAPGRITTGHFRPGQPTEFMEITETRDGYSTSAVQSCDWWRIS